MKKSDYISQAEFPRSQALYQCLQSFSDQMQSKSKLTDGVLTARVVGEFSAGKTRFLRELFGDFIPEPLFPISSLERQTRLQLEITYGESPELTLIQREEDYKPACTVKTLLKFPERQELNNIDPMLHRLRLTLNEPRLILNEGDGYSDDKNPKRLFLIDTPGWNSGDDELAERDASDILTGLHNLALVYVSQASRLDGVLNAEHLSDLIGALAAAEFLDQAKLIFIVTNCPSSEGEKFKKRAQDMVYRLWQDLGNDQAELSLDVFCVDFYEMPIETLKQFRNNFWNSLLDPLKQNEPAVNPLVKNLREWNDDWNIDSSLQETEKIFSRARTLLKKARQEDEFIAGMNMYRLIGLDQVDIRKKIKTTWLKQLECEEPELHNWNVSNLPEVHPMTDWWNTYWQRNIEITLAPIKNFFEKTQYTINTLTPEIKDLKSHLLSALARPHDDALASLDNSFSCLVKTAQDLIDEPVLEKKISTLFMLSILQARYEDYYAKAKS